MARPRLSFLQLPADIHLQILYRLDLPAASRLLCACRALFALALPTFHHHAKYVYGIDTQHDQRFEYEPCETSWMLFLSRLDSGCCGWRGFCRDASLISPYKMELIVQKATKSIFRGLLAHSIGKEACSISGLDNIVVTEWEGLCRWKSFQDALTVVLATHTRLMAISSTISTTPNTFKTQAYYVDMWCLTKQV